MRAYVPEYELVAPESLSEALSILAREPGVWRPIAGGTDLMVLYEAGKLPYRKFISIARLPELRGVVVDAGAISIGAVTTYTEIREHPVLQTEFPLLCQAAGWTGSIANQNRGTLGGNIVNASPAADSCPPLLAYGAELELTSTVGTRRVTYDEFHTGYKMMLLQPQELLARIWLPRRGRAVHHYCRKVGTRNAQAISKVCLAATAEMQGPAIARVRIALGSVAPTVVRCQGAEEVLVGRALDPQVIASAKSALMEEIKPISDIRSTAAYRRQVAGNLLEQFLRAVLLGGERN